MRLMWLKISWGLLLSEDWKKGGDTWLNAKFSAGLLACCKLPQTPSSMEDNWNKPKPKTKYANLWQSIRVSSSAVHAPVTNISMITC